ncbi:MAG: TIGR01777 family oxidoreductase [Solirubrobacteraceae bacterium]|nr:TIGR01777 family oxidoreductase [Solirubrobacteraceae bacterium]
MRVTVTGATGGIGRLLVATLLERGDDVTVLTRDPDRAYDALGPDVHAHAWDSTSTAPAEALAGRDAVINLAGERIDQRWSDEAKGRIMSSRRDGTRHLVEGIALTEGDDRPLALISGSATGIYGDRTGDGEIDETAEPGEGFLSDVCVAWEAEARRAEALGLRVVVIRTGTVLDPEHGALVPLKKVAKFGVLGPLGSGRQPFPWIHVTDELGLILHALDSGRASGPINAVAPGIVTQAQFARALGKAVHRPAFLPAPAFAAKTLLGEQAELLLSGAWAVPSAARDLGYAFAFPELPSALDDLLSGRSGDEPSGPLGELLG